jgi:GxxExxY protein
MRSPGVGLRWNGRNRAPCNFEESPSNRAPLAPQVVGGTVLVELKSLESLSQVHKKQMLTYLKLSHRKHGLLINFGSELLTGNIERLGHEADELAS